MPRMSRKEVKDIIDKGLARLEMTMNDNEKRTVVGLSQGPSLCYTFTFLTCYKVCDR